MTKTLDMIVNLLEQESGWIAKQLNRRIEEGRTALPPVETLPYCLEDLRSDHDIVDMMNRVMDDLQKRLADVGATRAENVQVVRDDDPLRHGAKCSFRAECTK